MVIKIFTALSAIKNNHLSKLNSGGIIRLINVRGVRGIALYSQLLSLRYLMSLMDTQRQVRRLFMAILII